MAEDAWVDQGKDGESNNHAKEVKPGIA